LFHGFILKDLTTRLIIRAGGFQGNVQIGFLSFKVVPVDGLYLKKPGRSKSLA